MRTIAFRLTLTVLALMSFLVAGTAYASPINDGFSSPTIIKSLPFHDDKNLWGNPPNLRDNDPSPSCTGRQGYNTVWYKLAGNNNWIDTNTFGSDYDTVIAVYRYDNRLTEVACNDDAWDWATLSSEAPFFAQAGKAYYIMVGTYDDDVEPGQLDFCVGIWGDLPCR